MALPYSSLLSDDGTAPAGAIRAMVRNPGEMTATPLPVPVSHVQPSFAALMARSMPMGGGYGADYSGYGGMAPDWQSAPSNMDYINSGLATIGRLAAPKDESSKTLSDAVQDLIKRNQDFYAKLGKLNSGTSDSDAPGSYDSYRQGARTIESGTNDDAVNPLSGATGRYQFIPATAKWLMPELDLAHLKDPDVQEELMRRYTDKSVATLVPLLGRKPTGAELYLLHLFGQGGGSSILRDMDAPLADKVSNAALADNKGLIGSAQTGRQLLAALSRRFGG